MHWLVLTVSLLTHSTLAQTPTRPPCWHSEFAAFSFLEGEWKIAAEDRLGNGTWEKSNARAWISRDLQGCALVENFGGTRENKPFSGRAYYGFNSVTGQLQRVWVDSEHGMYTPHEGAKAGDEIALDYSMTLRGQPVILRDAFFDITPAAFKFESRRSNDGGKTWDVTSKLTYTRVVQEPVAPLPSVELPAELARVLTDYEVAWAAKDAKALAALFTEDGFVLSSGQMPVRGREAIAKRYEGAGGPLSLRGLAWSVNGDTGYIIGGYAGEEGKDDDGKFTLTLKKHTDGRWLIMSDMDNTNRRR